MGDWRDKLRDELLRFERKNNIGRIVPVNVYEALDQLTGVKIPSGVVLDPYTSRDMILGDDYWDRPIEEIRL